MISCVLLAFPFAKYNEFLLCVLIWVKLIRVEPLNLRQIED